MRPLRERFLASVGQTSPAPMGVEVERAEGVFLYTPAGQRVFDLVSGVSVSNVGHSNPAVVEAVQRQAADYMHTMVYGETIQRVQVEYAERIGELTGLDSVYFVNSGAEAIEGALKLAKRATGRTELISMRGAYHGSTHGALSIQGGEDFKAAFRPLLPDTRLLRFNSFEDLDQITERTACVAIEAVQGEAGVRPPATGYFDALQKRCAEVGALVVLDEIQTGFGRTGSMFAAEKYGLQPDILCLAKALGGGLPLGAFAARRELMNQLTFDPVLGHITTFGGNPVCCAAGLAATNYIVERGLCGRAEEAGARFERNLADAPGVREIRRSGLLLAVELGSAEKMYRTVEGLTAAGVLTDWFLFCDTAFRISPPLTITEGEVDEASGVIEHVLKTTTV